MASLRPVKPLRLPKLEAVPPDCGAPTLRLVDPETLLIDETYQRNLSRRSLEIIGTMIAAWDWRAFKPPVCAESEGALHIIDGQHTAIGAASNPHIDQIPVLVVLAKAIEARAGAFVKHNRDRVKITPTQLHFALIEAGDEDALTIRNACERAAVTVLKHPPANGRFREGETIAVSTMQRILSRRYAMGLRRVLDVCRDAQLAPVSAAALRAVENLLFADEFAGSYDPGDIATTLRSKLPELEREAAAFAAQHRLQYWRSLAVQIGRNTKRRRNGRKRAA